MLLDQVINENLRPSRKKSKRKRSDGLEEKEAKRKKLMCFFRQCLPGSLLQPISESSDLLLSLAVDAPQAEARKMVELSACVWHIKGSSAAVVCSQRQYHSHSFCA